MENQKIKIFIVDDNDTYRGVLFNILDHSKLYTVVGEASNGFECLEKIENIDIDIILMDINMPELDGIQTTKIINWKNPRRPKIIALTQHEEFEYTKSMILAGAVGYVLKSEVGKKLQEAIEYSNNGKMLIPEMKNLK